MNIIYGNSESYEIISEDPHFWHICHSERIMQSKQRIKVKRNKIMQVKVVSLQNCSATPPTTAMVKETAKEMGVAINLIHKVVTTPEEAKKHRHIGSPTVQINGLDIDPGARDIEQFSLT